MVLHVGAGDKFGRSARQSVRFNACGKAYPEGSYFLCIYNY